MDRVSGFWKSVWAGLQSRYLSPALITCILIGGQVTFGFLESLGQTLTAILSSVLTEFALGRLTWGVWPGLVSAYITGISVGILIRSPLFWPYVLCSVLSIASKYVLRWRGRHLWNPSNFGVSIMLFLAPEVVAGLSIQWGNTLWTMVIIWILGSAALWRLRRFHICAVYVISFLAFALIRCVFTGQAYLTSIAPITGPMYQLFIFFMITDPRTTVLTRKGQCFVAFLVAFVEMILRLNEAIYAPFYALFLVGPAANAFEIWRGSVKVTADGHN